MRSSLQNYAQKTQCSSSAKSPQLLQLNNYKHLTYIQFTNKSLRFLQHNLYENKTFYFSNPGIITNATLYFSDDVVPNTVFEQSTLPLESDMVLQKVVLPKHSIAHIQIKLS